MTPELNRIYVGDCLDYLRSWPADLVQTVVTSPPYWGLRDYGVPGQMGLEPTPGAYCAKIVEVFREVRRVLRDDGTLWLNLGDSYAGGGNNRGNGSPLSDKQSSNGGATGQVGAREIPYGLKPKDMVGIPWRVAFALQADGWYLRSDIIWAKPNPMPESVTDRPTKAHEYLFLLTKNEKYFYDQDSIREPFVRIWNRTNGGSFKPVLGKDNPRYSEARKRKVGQACAHVGDYPLPNRVGANKRSVWTVATVPFTEAHFATFPPDLIKPCILAGSRPNDIVLDPFMGAGTSALVATAYGRKFLGIELNPVYAEMAERRIAAERAQMKMAI